MPKVYLVQQPSRYDQEKGRRVNIHDISSASIFGDITAPMFPHNGVSYLTQHDVHEVRRLLKDYSDEDCILCIGDPAAIGLSLALASEINRGKFNVLRWDRTRREYIKLSFDIRS